ncbi:helix-turn-helix transcriptional regulator [Nocardia alba]|uniref:Regulatory LuxR family protein n=1 Tax=Nocardia alba TaxID=225051 RepID=A0A4R1FAU3_9NOCA|nr:helix-turn-helix transcriptional regulator [Nocardia alba]TCJ89922.1 regulatory LuxR family protein [Nocardia alba]
MAKKGLKQPELPPGDRLRFFEFLRELAFEAGDRSVADIAADLPCSHQAIYKALTGPRMPSENIVKVLVTHFADEDAVEGAIELFKLGVLEQRRIPRAVGDKTATAPTADAQSAPTGEHESAAGEHEPQSPPPSLSAREEEIRRLSALGLTATEIAQQLHSSVHTVRSHTARIRAKYQAADQRLPGRDEVQELFSEQEWIDAAWDRLRQWQIDNPEQARRAFEAIEEFTEPGFAQSPLFGRNRLEFVLSEAAWDLPLDVDEKARKRWMESGARATRIVFDKLRELDPPIERPGGRAGTKGAQKDLALLYDDLQIVQRLKD